MRDLRIPFFTVLFVFLGFFAFTKVFGPIPFFVNSVTTTKESLFTVDGKGEVSAVPDTAFLNFGVTKESQSVENAKNQVNTVINQITKDLKQIGVEEKNIKTTNFSVNPNYDYTFPGRERITGYTVSANMEVKVKPIEKANNAIDIATKDGANQVGGVQFVLDDQKQKDLENEARMMAIKEAKSKAQSIASAAGIRLGRIVDVKEGSSPRPIRYALPMAADLGQKAVEQTQLNPGENKITVTISLSYETF